MIEANPGIEEWHNREKNTELNWARPIELLPAHYCHQDMTHNLVPQNHDEDKSG